MVLGLHTKAQMPANINNPYDAAGEMHNDMFNYVRENVPSPVTYKSIIRLEDQYLAENKSSFTASSIAFSKEYQDFMAAFESSPDKAGFLVTEAGYSSEGAAYFQKMMTALNQTDYDALYHSMVSLEEMILQDKSLAESESQQLLVACAVGRHSAYNWIYYTSGSMTEKKNGWTADASGALAGGLVGAVIGGTVTLGAATVPGWLGGAVIGGATASLEALFNLAFED